MSSEPGGARPSAELSREHRVIERVLRVLQHLVGRAERGEGFEPEPLGKCVRFFRLFADACHHGKEEDLFFPMLEQRGIPREGGPIGMMLSEHKLARELTRKMGDALEQFERGDADAQSRFCRTAREYLELLHQHIFKEDNVLFRMADGVISDDDRRTLCAKFGEVGCRAFEGQRREELERLADELSEQWPEP
jgi:hemerythrin-like domain-containing protein